MTRKRTIKNIIEFCWSLFISGLLTILPLTLTVALFNFSLKLLKGWLAPLRVFEPEFMRDVPYAEILLSIALLIGLGGLLRFFLVGPIVSWLESLIFRIPLVRPVYSGIKQLVHAFNPHDQISFKRIVLLEFPREGVWGLGFLTNELPAEFAPHKKEKFVSIFIPTTPNPTTGYYVIAPEKSTITVDITRQEAMAIIISGGIIQPDRFNK